MEVSVRVLGHVVIEDDVDPLDVHPSAKEVGGHQDTALEVLELLVARQAGRRERDVARVEPEQWGGVMEGGVKMTVESGAEPGPELESFIHGGQSD